MEERPLQEQLEHDLVISAAAQQFSVSQKYNIYTNPGIEQRYRVGGLYPDIVAVDKNSGRVKFVIEVETTSSVDKSEAKQWKELQRLGATFYLLVPYRAEPAAEQVSKTAGVKCHFGHYVEDEKGRFRITLKKD